MWCVRSSLCGVAAGFRGLDGGDDVGEVGLQRIAPNGEAECDVHQIGASGPVLGAKR